MDECFNQLDEIALQAFVSILSNCGPVGAPSGGEFAASQNSLNLSNDNDNDNDINLGKGNDSLSNLSVGNINNINCYGSVLASNGASSGSQIVDLEMSDSIDPRKRPILEDVSSDDTSGDLALISKSLYKKSKKAGTKSRVPVASALLGKKGVSVAECSLWFQSSGFGSAVSCGSSHSCGCIVLFRPSLTLLNSWCDFDGHFCNVSFLFVPNYFVFVVFMTQIATLQGIFSLVIFTIRLIP